MADYYVKSGAGGTADGSSWTNAYTTLKAAMEARLAGDRFFVSHQHAESQASSITITSPGTLASPQIVLCVNDGATPPTTMATTATVTVTGITTITTTGHYYMEGITFSSGTSGGGNIVLASATGDVQRYKKCGFNIAASVSTSRIHINSIALSVAPSEVHWDECTYKFAHATQCVNVGNAYFTSKKGGLSSGGTNPTALYSLTTASRGGKIIVDGLDCSNMGTAVDMVGTCSSAGEITFRNVKMPASWAGDLSNTTPIAGVRIKMHNWGSTDVNYRIWEEDYSGSVREESTIVRTGGASDGTTTLAWKMVSSANAEYPSYRLESPEIVRWNDSTGGALSATVEIVHDSQGAGSGSKFQNDEIWLEVQYLGTSGTPLALFANDSKADALATAANQTDSSETWTTTGLTTPVKQKLEVVFTPEEKGFIIAKVVLAKASKTVYVDPKITVA